MAVDRGGKMFTVDASESMKSVFVLVAIGVSFLAGCAQYGNEAMAGAAVDMPDEPPLSEQPSAFGTPTPAPGEKVKGQNGLGD